MGNFKSLHVIKSYDDVKRFLTRNNCTYLRRYFVWRKIFNVYKLSDKFNVKFLENLSPYFSYKIENDILIVCKNLKDKDFENPVLWQFKANPHQIKSKRIKNYIIKFSKLHFHYYVRNDIEKDVLYICDTMDDAVKWIESRLI